MPPNLTLLVATEVRAEMGRQRATQRIVGQILGKSQPQISARLLGELPFTTAELDKLAEAWSIPVTTFLPSAGVPVRGETPASAA